MCGIIAIVSRPPTRPDADRATSSSAVLDAALAARRDVARPSPRRLAAVDRLLHGVPGLLALVGRHELVAGDHGPPRPARRLRRRGRRRAGASRPRRRRRSSGQRRARSRCATRCGRSATIACAPPARSTSSPAATPVRPRSPATSRSSRRCRRSTGWRCAAATRPALHLFVWDHGLDVDDPAVAAAARRAHARPAVPERRPSASPAGCLIVRLQGGGRDRRARRQHRGAARGDHRRRAAAPRPAPAERAQVAVLGHTRWASVGIISEPNCHPVNSDELEQPAARRRRTSSARSTATSTTTPTSRSTHGLRIAGPITTDAKVIPALVARHAGGPATWSRRSAAPSPAFEGRVAIGAAAADEPGPAAPRPARQRPGRVRRPRRGPLHRRQRAVRRGRGDGAATSASTASTAARSSALDAARSPARSRACAAVAYDGTDAAGDRGRHRDRRGDDPRHRPRRLPALPAQGDHRGAGQPPPRRCAARSSSATGCCTPCVGERALPAGDRRPPRRRRRSRKIRVIGQGTAAVAGQSLAAVLDELAGGALDVDADHRHRAVAASACAST